MTTFITVIHIVVCFLLIAVILLQAGRGQGLAGASFGGGNVQSLLGTKGADFMTKVTTVAAISFMVTCLTLSVLEAQKSKSLLRASGPVAPMDVDQIRKALEKVKAEAGEKATEAGEKAADAIEQAKAEIQAEVEGVESANVPEDVVKAAQEAGVLDG